MLGIIFYCGRHDLMYFIEYAGLFQRAQTCAQKYPNTHMPFVQYMCTRDGQKKTLGQFNSVESITEKWGVSGTQVIKSLWNNSPFSKLYVKNIKSQLKSEDGTFSLWMEAWSYTTKWIMAHVISLLTCCWLKLLTHHPSLQSYTK
jgi:hypothetical protein